MVFYENIISLDFLVQNVSYILNPGKTIKLNILASHEFVCGILFEIVQLIAIFPKSIKSCLKAMFIALVKYF